MREGVSGGWPVYSRGAPPTLSNEEEEGHRVLPTSGPEGNLNFSEFCSFPLFSQKRPGKWVLKIMKNSYLDRRHLDDSIFLANTQIQQLGLKLKFSKFAIF